MIISKIRAVKRVVDLCNESVEVRTTLKTVKLVVEDIMRLGARDHLAASQVVPNLKQLKSVFDGYKSVDMDDTFTNGVADRLGEMIASLEAEYKP